MRYVRAYARPHFELDIEHGYEDPHSIHAVGDVAIRVHAANALLQTRRRMRRPSASRRRDADTVAEASIAVAEVKAYGTEAALLAASKLIELGGARSTPRGLWTRPLLAQFPRASLHDAARWKYHHIGTFYLNAAAAAASRRALTVAFVAAPARGGFLMTRPAR